MAAPARVVLSLVAGALERPLASLAAAPKAESAARQVLARLVALRALAARLVLVARLVLLVPQGQAVRAAAAAWRWLT